MAKQLYTTDDIKRIVAPVAREYGVGRLSLFGSYARGEAGPNSDIDIRIIDSGKIRGMLRLAGFMNDLEDRFGVKVDVIDVSPTASEFLNEINGDEVIIYDQR